MFILPEYAWVIPQEVLGCSALASAHICKQGRGTLPSGEFGGREGVEQQAGVGIVTTNWISLFRREGMLIGK